MNFTVTSMVQQEEPFNVNCLLQLKLFPCVRLIPDPSLRSLCSKTKGYLNKSLTKHLYLKLVSLFRVHMSHIGCINTNASISLSSNIYLSNIHLMPTLYGIALLYETYLSMGSYVESLHGGPYMGALTGEFLHGGSYIYF